MPKMRIPQYIDRNPHFVKLLPILAYAKNEDTSVYRDQSTFNLITQILLSLCQK